MRLPRALVPALSLALLAGCSKSGAPPRTIAVPDLRAEGTALVLRQADGRVLRGAQLQGAVLRMELANGAIDAVKLASIRPDPDDPEILRHEFQIEDRPGHWRPMCEANYEGDTWGFPIALPEGHPGREATITLSCASGAVAKCVRFGYKPWGRGRHGEDLLPYHAACVHMVRADYAGDGTPHTKAGTFIQIQDDAVRWKRTPAPDPGFTFEAGWSPRGAACVARTRWPDLLTLDQLQAQAPGLMHGAACTEEAAKAGGALLFNRTRVEARLGE